MDNFLWIVAGMLLVTYLPRLVPLLILTRLEIPQPVIQWLRYIPVAVLAALLAPSLLVQNNQLALSLHNSYLLAAFPTFIVAAKYKNNLATVLCGVVFLILIRLATTVWSG